MRTAAEALARYNRQTTNRPGMCLWECQEAYGSPHWFPGAVSEPGRSSQWNNARERVRNRDIPLGAPVYWYNPGGWGHIALYAGNGKVRSSDAGGRGRMGTVSIDWITRNWYPRGRFLGWTRDIGGQMIDFGTSKPTPPTPPRDWLDMATEAQVRKIVREEVARFAEHGITVTQPDGERSRIPLYRLLSEVHGAVALPIPVRYGEDGSTRSMRDILGWTQHRTRELTRAVFGTPDVAEGADPAPEWIE